MGFGYFVSFACFDKGLIEILWPIGIVSTVFVRSKNISLLHTGFLPTYTHVIIYSSFVFAVFGFLNAIGSSVINHCFFGLLLTYTFFINVI
jgi:hypothetical protein